MSRAKDGKIVGESQKSLYRIKKISLVLAIVLVALIAYSLATRKDPDAARIDDVLKAQFKVAASEDLAPMRKQIAELEKVSGSRRLSDKELAELEGLREKTGDVKQALRVKYGLKKERLAKMPEPPREFMLPFSEELKKEGKPQEGVASVEDGPGTFHRLWSNKRFTAISLEINGQRPFDMPAGWNSWTGHGPPGRLLLVAKEPDTVVKTWKIR